MINLLDTEFVPINLIHNGAKDFLLLTVFSSKEEAFKNMSDHSLYATFSNSSAVSVFPLLIFIMQAAVPKIY